MVPTPPSLRWLAASALLTAASPACELVAPFRTAGGRRDLAAALDAGAPTDATGPHADIRRRADGTAPPDDGATVVPDGAPALDSASLPPDSTAQRDSATLPPDSATLPPDSATLPPDSATLPPDSTTLPPDSTPQLDAPPSPDGGAATTPCTGGAVVEQTWPGGRMVICKLATQSLTQCTAHTACNVSGGWTLCTASQYQALGGTTQGYIFWAWIGGCPRDNGKLQLPGTSVCPSCANATSGNQIASWFCSGASGNRLDYANLGLITASSCNRVGVNTKQTEARWTVRRAGAATNAAVCCR